MKIEISDPQIISVKMDDVYQSFPDMVRLPDGDILCVYREAIAHHPKSATLVFLRSSDNGESWSRKEYFDSAIEGANAGYVYNCPRLSLIDDRLFLICDTKSSTNELEARWNTAMWFSRDYGSTWDRKEWLDIHGLVPDKIVKRNDTLLMGYHIIEIDRHTNGKRLVQMLAHSHDSGYSWRDRTTVAEDEKHDFCEGSFVSYNSDLICFLRDNRDRRRRAQVTTSKDGGYLWSECKALPFTGHRLVAGVKQHGAFAGGIIGTYRDTSTRSISLFVYNPLNHKTSTFIIDSQPMGHMIDFGYSSWLENEDGSLLVAYYIARHYPKPFICLTRITMK